MPRVCSLCNNPRRAAVDAELVAGNPLRHIASRYGTSTAALARHRPHLAEAIAVAERRTGLNTVADVQRRLSELQDRVEILVRKLEAGKDHRLTLIGLRECRDGLKCVYDVLVASSLERRIRALEDGVTDETGGIADDPGRI